ncbi:hypothetical protein ccbrp13_32110 [Ktedonobacteria bacterium brp13]|nr:hypothetical protein ccbrp13_32110 [Ktedonobacteria bacterium brp13]
MLVREGFAEQGPDGEMRLQKLYGRMDTKTRETIKAAFQADPADSSVRILEDPHGNYPPIEVFDVPDLDGSWAKCTEGFWHPHTQQKRPIVFDHTLSQGRDQPVEKVFNR